MSYANRKEELMDVGMRIIARKGIAAFSMKQVTDYVGVSEALIYRYFMTREIFLYSCYEQVHRQIAAIFQSMAVQIPNTDEEVYEIIYSLWMKYFSFLVKNDYRTVFYFEYRYFGGLSNYKENSAKNEEAKHSYFSSFAKLIRPIYEKYRLGERVFPDFLWAYILDTSGIFARRIIQGTLPDTPESYEIVFGLLSGGIMGLLEEK